MMDVELVTVSKERQIVLPEDWCQEMQIKEGEKLVAYSDGKTLMLKTVRPTTMEEYREKMEAAQKWAASVGLTEEDVETAIKEVRREARGQA